MAGRSALELARLALAVALSRSAPQLGREGDHGEGEMPRLFGQVQLWQPVDPAHKQREV